MNKLSRLQPVWKCREQVDMVRHHNEFEHPIPLTVEVLQTLGDDPS